MERVVATFSGNIGPQGLNISGIGRLDWLCGASRGNVFLGYGCYEKGKT